MYQYDKMYEVESAIEVCNSGYNAYKRRSEDWRSKHRQWDYIICKICTGCGKALSRYDTLKGHAFCYQCRQILFPETVNTHKSYGKRFRIPRSSGHSI
jgi:hypothetical protein